MKSVRLDRLALLENARRILAIVSTTSIPTFDFQKLRKPIWALCAGVPFGCPSPRKGGIAAESNQVERVQKPWQIP